MTRTWMLKPWKGQQGEAVRGRICDWMKMVVLHSVWCRQSVVDHQSRGVKHEDAFGDDTPMIAYESP